MLDPAVEPAAVTEDAADAAPSVPVPVPDAGLVEQDLLIEEISIDGMCGVY